MSSRDLTEGAVWQNLLQLAGPMVFGIVAVISVSLIDTYFVGKLGQDPLTALSFTFPVTLTISSLAIGLGAGASSVVSRSVGSGADDEAKRRATDSLILATTIAITVAIIGYFSVEWLFGLLGASGEVLDLVGRYMAIWFIAIPLLVLQIVSNAIVRAVGDALWPSAVMIGSAFVNIAVTPLLIFGWGPIPAFDIEGAALGTLIAWLFSLCAAMVLIIGREKMILFCVPPVKSFIKSCAAVLKVGVPAAFGNAVNPIGIAVVTAILATFGDTVVAGFGIATRVESFSVIPMLALSSAIGPFSGQNWGASNADRIKSALWVSYGVCIAWAIVISVVLWFFAQPIASIFTDSEEVQKAAASYLRIVPLSVWGYGFVIITAGGLNAIGHSKTGLLVYLTRTALLYIPLSFAASMLAGSWAVFTAIAIANALAGLAVAAYVLNWLDRQDEVATQPA